MFKVYGESCRHVGLKITCFHLKILFLIASHNQTNKGLRRANENRVASGSQMCCTGRWMNKLVDQ